jgi:hypothetical protein
MDPNVAPTNLNPGLAYEQKVMYESAIAPLDEHWLFVVGQLLVRREPLDDEALHLHGALGALEEQRRTRRVWSWSDGAECTVGRVIFVLRAEGPRTRLTLRHIGDEGKAMAKMIRERWPIKLQALASMLGDEG